jgi:tRNA(Ile)-lysidine synthase
MNTNILYQKIYTAIQKDQLITSGDTIIIGLSGGPDSIFLLHVLASLQEELNLKLIAAHLDHGWRPDSGKDVQFCQEAASALGVEFIARKFSDLGLSLKFNGSLEELGRQARRHFFETVRQEYQAQAIALGHHLQDQQETFFIRLIRGTSLSGLVSMRPRHGAYIRPLLSICKDDMLAYLHEHKIPYLNDPTNDADTFLRNRIRQQVLPALKACDARFERSFTATMERLHALEQHLEVETAQLLARFALCKFDKKGLDLKQFLALPAIMQERLLVAWFCQEQVPFPVREQFLHEIMKFLQSPRGGIHAVHHAWSIGKRQQIIWIEKSLINNPQ